jgi:hypothetical protein
MSPSKFTEKEKQFTEDQDKAQKTYKEQKANKLV